MLRGGGGERDLNQNITDKNKSDSQQSPPILKRQVSQSKKQHLEESPPKRRKILSDYKQRTPKKSPHKTPTKRKTPRLRCKNVCCRVGFSTNRAKLHHERFLCSFSMFSAKEVLSSSSNTSGETEKNCRFCNQLFSQSRNRIRHEQNKHQGEAQDIPISPCPLDSSFGSPNVETQNDLETPPDWKTPTSSFRRKVFRTEAGGEGDPSVLFSQCRYCGQTFARLYRCNLHEETCTFKVPQTLKELNIPRIRIVKNSEKLSKVLGYACIEDLYEYNSMVSVCVPGIYPLVFLGHSHFGSCIPPIIKETASNKSFDILLKLLRLHGKVALHNHVILVDENSGNESYLGPQLLLPNSPRIEILNSDIRMTTVKLKPLEEVGDTSEDSDDVDDEEEVSVYYLEGEEVVQHHSLHPVEDVEILSEDALTEEDQRYLSEMFPSQYNFGGAASGDDDTNDAGDLGRAGRKSTFDDK